MGGGRGEWGERSLGVRMHSGFFVLATFDETALVLEPVGDAEGVVVRETQGEGRGEVDGD